MSERASDGQFEPWYRCLSAASSEEKSATSCCSRGCEVEAAGIEPASRDASVRASTCVVDALGLTQLSSRRQDMGYAVREQVLTPSVLDMTRSDSEFVTSFWISPTKTRSRGRL